MARTASAAAIHRDLVRACARLDARGILAGAEGNLSVRASAARIVVTPAGLTKGTLRAASLVTVAPDGRKLAGKLGASSELPMHVAIYAARPDVHAVVHAHPRAATAFALGGPGLPVGALAELDLVIGPVPVVPYARPGSEALARAVVAALRKGNAVLLANHGAVTVGPTLQSAIQRMESLEQFAQIVINAHILAMQQRVSWEEGNG